MKRHLQNIVIPTAALLFILGLFNAARVTAQESTDWPSFRGHGARGVADGFKTPTQWNAGSQSGKVQGVLWETEVPGLGHSSPVIYGDKLFLLTAIPKDGKSKLQIKSGGKPTAAKDGEQDWVILCYDKNTGKEIWRKSAHQGKPKATRHAKATHANTSVTVDGNNVLAFFGSEGLYCYDMDGNLKWSRDLGVINISKYGIGWGFSSSPTIHKDSIAIVCDDPSRPFVALLRLDNGKDIWRVDRKKVCDRSWGSPMVHASKDRTQVIVNGWPWIVSYDFETGKEIWKIKGGGDNPVPTPFEANGWIYITNAHGGKSPIYVVHPEASGNLSDSQDSSKADGDEADLDQQNESSNKKTNPFVWTVQRGGSYMSTPVVYGDYLYLGNTNGTVRCFNAKTGAKIYEKRLGARSGIVASLVAADDKIYCASEDGNVYVLRAGPEFEILATNSMGQPCLASPALSKGVIYFRTISRLIAIR